jgi:hypothetical protein
MKHHMVKITAKILLTFVIPAILLGYNLLKGSSIFKDFLGTSAVEKALNTKLLTQYGEPGQLILSREAHPDEFKAVWDLIRANSSTELRQAPPHFISRIGVEDGAFVTLPTSRRVQLVPEATPLIVIYCPYVQGCPISDGVMVGSVGDLRRWAQEKEKSARLWVDVGVSLLSIMGGILMELAGAVGTLTRLWLCLCHRAAWWSVRTTRE